MPAPGESGLCPALPPAALSVLPDVPGKPDGYARHAAPVPGVPRGRGMLPGPESGLHVRPVPAGGQCGGEGGRRAYRLPARRDEVV